MSQENVEVVLGLGAALGRGDIEGFVSAWHPDGEYRAAIQQAVEGEEGVFRGHDGVRRWFVELHDVWDEIDFEVVELRDLGERLVAVGVVRFRGKGSGIQNTETMSQVFTMREGKVIAARDYRTREQAFEAVGLHASAMAWENVEGQRQALDAFNRRDRATWLAIGDPELETVPSRDWPESDRIQGREAVWDFFVTSFAPWKDGSLRYLELFDVGGDTTVGQVWGEMCGAASGAAVQWSFWCVVSFRNGKSLRIEWFDTRAEALEAAGLGE